MKRGHSHNPFTERQAESGILHHFRVIELG